MSEAPRFFVGPEDAEINAGNYRRFFHHADEEEEEEEESVSCCFLSWWSRTVQNVHWLPLRQTDTFILNKITFQCANLFLKVLNLKSIHNISRQDIKDC